jgi:hypothetical protein
MQWELHWHAQAVAVPGLETARGETRSLPIGSSPEEFCIFCSFCTAGCEPQSLPGSPAAPRAAARQSTASQVRSQGASRNPQCHCRGRLHAAPRVAARQSAASQVGVRAAMPLPGSPAAPRATAEAPSATGAGYEPQSLPAGIACSATGHSKSTASQGRVRAAIIAGVYSSYHTASSWMPRPRRPVRPRFRA